MKLDVLVSCFEMGICRFAKSIPDPETSVRYIIIHQCPSLLETEGQEIARDLSQRPDVHYELRKEKGLSKSRNRALELSNADVALLCDEDVKLLPGFYQKIKSAFDKHRAENEIAGITFQYQRASNHLAKAYPPKGIKHHRRTLGWVSSIEICIKPQWLKAHNICFDERFGLGAEWPTGEEYILLQDVIAQRGDLFFEPITLSEHADESSGHQWSEELIRAKGALFKRVWKRLAGLANYRFAQKHAKSSGFSSSDFRLWLMEGAKAFKAHGKS